MWLIGARSVLRRAMHSGGRCIRACAPCASRPLSSRQIRCICKPLRFLCRKGASNRCISDGLKSVREAGIVTRLDGFDGCPSAQSREEAIQRNIRRAQDRKLALKAQAVACPGCAQRNMSPRVLLRHAQGCCPDLLLPAEVRSCPYDFQRTCILRLHTVIPGLE
jgi:hypothetical protein